MNINTGVMSLNVNNILTKKENIKSALRINDETKVNNTETVEITRENLVAAESDVNNIDKVEELLKSTKDNILQNSAMALLSQANKQPNQVIGLLN